MHMHAPKLEIRFFLQWITVLAVWKVKPLASKQDFKCNYLLKKRLFIYL